MIEPVLASRVLVTEEVPMGSRRDSLLAQLRASQPGLLLVAATPSDDLRRALQHGGIPTTPIYPGNWQIDPAACDMKRIKLQQMLRAASPELDLSEGEFKLVMYHPTHHTAGFLLSSQAAGRHMAQTVRGRHKLRVHFTPSLTMWDNLWMALFLLQYPHPDQLEIGAFSHTTREWCALPASTQFTYGHFYAFLQAMEPPIGGHPQHSVLYLPSAVAGADLLGQLLSDTYTVRAAHCSSDEADWNLGVAQDQPPGFQTHLGELVGGKAADEFVVEAFRGLLLPELRSLDESASRLVADVKPTSVILSDHTYPDTALVAVAARRQGAAIVLAPHASVPVHIDAWDSFVPDATVSSWRGGARKWRALGVRDVRVNSQLNGLELPLRTPSSAKRTRSIRILYIGTAAWGPLYPVCSTDLFSDHQKGLLTPPGDIAARVSIVIKPRPFDESDTWYEDYLREDGRLRLTNEPISLAARNVQVAVCHDVLTTGLYEAALQGVPALFVSSDTVAEHVLRDEAVLPTISVDEFWSTIRHALDGSDQLSNIGKAQHRWLRSQTSFDGLPIPGWSWREQENLRLRRVKHRGLEAWRWLRQGFR